MTDQPSVTITPARIGFALSLLGLLTFGWQAASYVKQQEYRITAVEAYITDAKQQNRETLAELKHLNEAVTELATIIKGQASLRINGKDASLRIMPAIGTDGAGVGRNLADASRTGGHSFARDRAKLEISE
jgi:hypothetical protein